MIIGKNLKLARGKITQEAASKHIGVSRVQYSNIERGVYDIKADKLKMLCELFDVSADSILELDDNKTITIYALKNIYSKNISKKQK